MQRQLIHLVCGSTSIDEWMATLFWMDTPRPLDPAWSIERVERCLTQTRAVALQIAARNVPCVLDLGFSQIRSRADFADPAIAAGLSVQLHFIDVPADERWRRVARRNAQRGPTYQLGFDVTREMFDFVEGLWEPPTEAEMLAYDGVRISTTA